MCVGPSWTLLPTQAQTVGLNIAYFAALLWGRLQSDPTHEGPEVILFLSMHLPVKREHMSKAPGSLQDLQLVVNFMDFEDELGMM